MGIIDPSIIAVLKNYKQAQQGSPCKVIRAFATAVVFLAPNRRKIRRIKLCLARDFCIIPPRRLASLLNAGPDAANQV